MIQVLDIFRPNLVLRSNSVKFLQYVRKLAASRKKKCDAVQFQSPVICKLVEHAESSAREKDAARDGGDIDFPHVQTLSKISKEEIFGKVVMVRFDSVILLQGGNENQSSPPNAFSTIKYLCEAGARVILVGSWSENTNSMLRSEAYPSKESVACFLSLMLGLKVVPVKFGQEYTYSGVEDSKNHVVLLLENLLHFKGELANCSKFSKELAYGVDIIVNDAFSQSHKVLSSTVGVASFCYACVAGFYFEEELCKIKKIVRTNDRPYIAIVGGGNFADKATALRFLASICDGLVFVGSMAFQIMHALGIPIPLKLVDLGAVNEAVHIVGLTRSKNISMVLPKDVWCIKDHGPEQMKIFSVYSIPEGWRPIDIGPKSLQEMTDLLSKCKKIMWIGPMKFSSSSQDTSGTYKLAQAFCTLNQSSCDIISVGKLDFNELFQKSKSFSNANFVKSAAVVWEVLKRRKLPGLMALDRSYPSHVDWSIAYSDLTRPLVVDVGSGNGLFLFGMARRRKDENFLGLEMNTKLVDRCLDNVHQLEAKNVYFISTNATSSFRSIVSSYQGKLVLVSIQCPNPDFNKPEHRWRMLQRSLVEAIADTLITGGKVFLQSDIEAVALRMKKEFLQYSKGKLLLLNSPENKAITEGWLMENPFGVPSDWERHVLDRGNPMYRLLLSKVERG